MKKITLHFKDGNSIENTQDLDKIDLVNNLKNSIHKLKFKKLSEFEWKIWESEEDYQILNLTTKQLYNYTNQNGVILISMDLDEYELEYILQTIKKEEDDINN